MTRYELLKLNKTLLEALASNQISPAEVRKLDVYEQYLDMVAHKHKITYIVTHLACKYGIKERTIYTLVRRFRQEVNI